MGINVYSKIAIFGDLPGVLPLLEAISPDRVACLVGASRRPQYLEDLRRVASSIQKPFLVQPPRQSPTFNGFIASFASRSCDSLICNGYSMLIPPELLDLVSGCAINFHAALLPRNRGPNPVQWAIIKDDRKTGITMHLMDRGFDTGDILTQIELPIDEMDTWVTMMDKIIQRSYSFIATSLNSLFENHLSPQKQVSGLATRNMRLDENFPRIDFSKMTDREIFNLIRAQVCPLKGAYVEPPDRDRIYFPNYLPMDGIAALRAEMGSA